MKNQDVLWLQRFDNFLKAFDNLKSAVDLASKRELSELEEQGLIQTFEFTFELAWKTLKDYLEHQQVEVKFPRDVIKAGFQYQLLDEGDIWMDMLEKRNLMAHTYDEERAQIAFQLITKQYYQQIHLLIELFKQKANEQ